MSDGNILAARQLLEQAINRRYSATQLGIQGQQQ